MKKYRILFDNYKPVIGKSIYTIYCIIPGSNSSRTINLYQLFYVKSKDTFVFTKLVDLPKRLILRYNNATEYIDELIQEMESIGIPKFETVNEKIKSFETKKDLLEYENYRDNFLKIKRNKSKNLELLNEIKELRKELLKNHIDYETMTHF